MLRHQFRRFQTVRGKFHAVAVFLQHPAHEFPHADRIVRDHDHAFLIHAIDRFRGNRSACHSRRAGSENARGTGGCLFPPAPAPPLTMARTLAASFPPPSSTSPAHRRRFSPPPASGSAKWGEPQRTKSAGEIISVKGTFSVNFAPDPAALFTSISPFSAFRLERTTSSPTPRPASSVFTAAVENPGWNSISRRSRSVSRSAVSCETRPHSIALCFTRS